MRKVDIFAAFLTVLACLLIFATVIAKISEKCDNSDNLEVIAEEVVFIVSQFEEEIAPPEDPQESEKIDAALDWHYIDNVTLTAYCSCENCCGEYANNRPDGVVYTASGAKANANHTIAVDPSVIPLGSWVEIDGRQYHAEDAGSAVKGNHIDIYFDSHADACEFGKKVESVRWYGGLE